MPRQSEEVLQADGLCRTLGRRTLVQSVSLSVARGDVLGLLGLNGAGKSTTLQLLAGTLVPDAGSVRIDGIDMSEEPIAARAHIGYLPDEPPLVADMRVADYLTFTARLRRLDRHRSRDRVAAVLQQCDLADVARRRIAQLSKGYRQRIGLAQAIVHEPALLLLDEPSNGLDPQQMLGMRSLIRALAPSTGIVFSTHLLAEAQAVCNRIALLHAGRILHDAPTQPGDASLEGLFERLARDGEVA